MSNKVKESKEWKLDIAKRVSNRLDNGGKLLLNITYVSPRSTAWRYQVQLAYVNEAGAVETMSLTYWLAACLEESLFDAESNAQLREDEFGTNRYFVIAWKVGRVLHALGQADNALHVANGGYWRAV